MAFNCIIEQKEVDESKLINNINSYYLIPIILKPTKSEDSRKQPFPFGQLFHNFFCFIFTFQIKEIMCLEHNYTCHLVVGQTCVNRMDFSVGGAFYVMQ